MEPKNQLEVCGPVVSLRSLAIHVAEARGKAVVVRDDNGGIQRLEVQYDH